MNQRLGLLLFLALFLVQEQGSHFEVKAEDRGGFVKTEGVHFLLNGSPFYANGFNAYWLMFLASDPSQRAKVTSAFQEASSHGLSIGRTWAFSDGGYMPLQFSPGSYSEQMFQVSLLSYYFSCFFLVHFLRDDFHFLNG